MDLVKCRYRRPLSGGCIIILFWMEHTEVCESMIYLLHFVLIYQPVVNGQYNVTKLTFQTVALRQSQATPYRTNELNSFTLCPQQQSISLISWLMYLSASFDLLW